MTHQQNITACIMALRNDKTVNPKWRNKIVSKLEEAGALCYMLDSREISKGEMDSLLEHAPTRPIQPGQIYAGVTEPHPAHPDACICPPGGPFVPSCTLHGL